jgi:hypothetical protein
LYCQRFARSPFLAHAAPRLFREFYTKVEFSTHTDRFLISHTVDEEEDGYGLKHDYVSYLFARVHVLPASLGCRER